MRYLIKCNLSFMQRLRLKALVEICHIQYHLNMITCLLTDEYHHIMRSLSTKEAQYKLRKLLSISHCNMQQKRQLGFLCGISGSHGSMLLFWVLTTFRFVGSEEHTVSIFSHGIHLRVHTVSQSRKDNIDIFTAVRTSNLTILGAAPMHGRKIGLIFLLLIIYIILQCRMFKISFCS
jgi:hypothetical protein